MKPKKAMVERIATITPIATRNTPFTISPMMPQIFNADSRAEGVEFQTILSASRLSDIFLMRLSVASVVFVSGAQKGRD